MRDKRSVTVLIALVITVLLLSSCALPRFVVVDDPLSPGEHINLGLSYERKGELDNALKEYEVASRKLAIAYYYMANAYFLKGEHDLAEKNYKKVIRKLPDNADAYNNLAWLYYTKKENLDEAEELALKALELKPLNKDAYQDTLDRIRELKETVQGQ
ncbi:MAG: tetratricopeptide repeat protein [Nitrospirota bacterium]|nr:MAG: tetratricopeptide repeat protein [Nitrospirota bacterium]